MEQLPEFSAAPRRHRAWLVGIAASACWAAPLLAQAQESQVIATARYAAMAQQAVPPPAPVDNTTNPLAPPDEPAAPTPTTQPTTGLPGAPGANGTTAAPPTGLRPFTFTPIVGLQETYTDNVFVSPTNRVSDFITRGELGLDATVNGPRAQATANARLAYDAYARNSSLSGFSVQAYASGSYALAPNVLTLEAAGAATTGNISEFGSTSIDRSGVANRYQLVTYDVGPHLTTPVGDFADLDAVAHFEQVLYSAADHSTTLFLPSDASIVLVGGRLDTGKRFAAFESLTAAEYESDDHGFRTASGLESLFFALSPRFRIFGRAGYESVDLPPIININAPILSAGVEYTVNPQSKISVEGGERYNRAAWVANAYVQVSDRLLLTADYQEIFEPDQLYTADSFVNFVQLTGSLPQSLLSPNFSVNGNLYNQPSLDTTADAHVIYHWPRQTVDAFVSWRDRDFFDGAGHDRTLITQIDGTRQLRPDLRATISGGYGRTYESPVFGATEFYSATASLLYNVNSTVDLHAGYAFDHQQQLTGARLTIYENVVFLALSKRF